MILYMLKKLFKPRIVTTTNVQTSNVSSTQEKHSDRQLNNERAKQPRFGLHEDTNAQEMREKVVLCKYIV